MRKACKLLSSGSKDIQKILPMRLPIDLPLPEPVDNVKAFAYIVRSDAFVRDSGQNYRLL